ncbi:PREDICTED: protein SMAX1-LIKE 3 [Tarenaya hassleriana]|uniref:protein SMAX1-LIKE 3 n=1 Tax=Tarenaya hassleriana TaxID=28532 RepID=UPI00053C24FD|nr:PREDICTED: protein SMAX1-LIKE 3 [Tarenaya hassleriana]XP_010526833.1 PREDICTED: protein SMAX1-LIKE 3 [Tarenaya hassleriana]XP_010526911.1 PREDICTED: protein SMAX1-LIKE 3 [Tarenaya hassleriana]
MRAGGCTLQQALTPEAASVVKQAMALARRRGHAQVTPLHVASTMLSASTGLLRTACLQSHTHPLQCRALELCLNVALNRLPTSTGSPMLGAPTSPCPSISNALVAAFKRAQAHQRRGSIESQQQPILAVKIELEQLIISILDDPSVSRVMREAGFTSTQVKSKVEEAVSLEICSKTTSSSKPKEGSDSTFPLSQTKTDKLSTRVCEKDVMYVVENLVDKRRRNFVIIGECLATIDGVVRAVMEKVDKRDVPDALKDIKFITLSFSSFGQPSRTEVEQKLEELEKLVKSCIGKGVILNLGDLNWFVEYRTRSSGDHQLGRGNNYCAVEHMIMEIGKLARELMMGGNGRFWLMGIATSQTYLRCKSGHPSLELLWCLSALTIPASSLRLNLISDGEVEIENHGLMVKKTETNLIQPLQPLQLTAGTVVVAEVEQLTCCRECSVKFETEARSLQCSSSNSCNATTALPAWLQQYKKETQQVQNHNNDYTDSGSIKELRMKWNSICNSIHKKPSENSLTLSSLSPSSISYEFHRPKTLHRSNSDWPVIESNKYCHSLMPETSDVVPAEPNLRLFIPDSDNFQKTGKLFPSNPNSSMNSAASSSEAMDMEYVSKYKEMNPENLSVLCDALEKKVPWKKDIIPEIASTILKCRSGSTTRKQPKDKNKDLKEETWFFFEGVDVEAKEKIARELAELVFGSENRFVSICLSSFSSTRADSTEDLRNKRARDEQSWSYIEKFSEAISSDPHRVFFVEDIEQADYFSQMGFKRAIERGRVHNANGEESSVGDSIVILSCESFRSRSRACSPRKSDGSDHSEDKNVTLDLNLSLEDDDGPEDQSSDEIGLLEAVDGRFHFRYHHHHDA